MLNDKNSLRKLFLNRRLALSPDEYAGLNQQLLHQFKQLDLSAAHCVQLYLPIHRKREPNTIPVIAWLKETHPHIKRVFPKANFTDYSLRNYLDDDDLILEDNEFGIPEPISGNIIAADEINMLIIPLLAFDRRGYRLGYGKGFYDRFMAQCAPDTRFMGLSLFDPVEAIADINEYDLPLHQCITPTKIWTFV
jgi:5-formyltetrahydrofolate cyclo-ligase